MIPLRPLGVGEILDGAVQTIRRYPKPMLGLAAIVATVSQVVQVALLLPLLNATSDPGLDDPTLTGQQFFDRMSGSLGGVFGAGIIAGVARLFLSGVLTVMVSRAVLGQPVSVREAWNTFKPSIWRLLGFTIVALLLTAVGVLALCVGAVYVWVLLSLGAPALVLERATIRGAISRSRALVNGAWWRVFGILLLAVLISGVVSSIVSVPFTIVGFGSSGFFSSTGPHITLSYLILTSIGSILAATITYPFVAAVTALLYVDQRMRREGLDLELTRATSAR